MAMQNVLLGQGWPFPVASDESGTIPPKKYEESVKQSIVTILNTRVGERVMNPEFGSELWNVVFEPAVPATATLIDQYVREALNRWEPRISVLSVETSFSESERARADVTVTYVVNRTNSTENLVYPFYLQQQ